MEPEELTLWQERLLVARWGERILRECIQRGVPATAYYQEYQRFLELKGPTFSAAQFIKYFGAMQLEACLLSGWLKPRDLDQWGLKGAWEIDKKGNKIPLTKGRVFDSEDIRKIEDRWDQGECPPYAHT
jgi:hypothetical protein